MVVPPIGPPGKWSFAVLSFLYWLRCLDYGFVSGRSAETHTSVGFTNHFNISPTTKLANFPKTGKFCEGEVVVRCPRESQSIDHSTSPGG